MKLNINLKLCLVWLWAGLSTCTTGQDQPGTPNIFTREFLEEFQGYINDFDKICTDFPSEYGRLCALFKAEAIDPQKIQEEIDTLKAGCDFNPVFVYLMAAYYREKYKDLPDDYEKIFTPIKLEDINHLPRNISETLCAHCLDPRAYVQMIPWFKNFDKRKLAYVILEVFTNERDAIYTLFNWYAVLNPIDNDTRTGIFNALSLIFFNQGLISLEVIMLIFKLFTNGEDENWAMCLQLFNSFPSPDFDACKKIVEVLDSNLDL